MSDTTFEKFMHYGTAAQRAAFTPAPAAGIQPIYWWYETDTDKMYVYTTAWKGPFAGGAGGGSQSFTTTVTAAQTKQLFTTPISILATPGAGKINIATRITLGSTFGTVAYAGANNLEFRYTGAAGAKVTADIAAASLNFAAGVLYSTVAGVVTELAPVANALICVRVPVANPTLGDSILKFIVDYETLTLP